MPNPAIDLLSIKRGTITAPAGCGKTHLIAEALSRHSGPKPILVLTHTNAGVAALRGRLKQAGVEARNYRIMTIDGWVIRLLSNFPTRAGIDPAILSASKPSYPRLRKGAIELLKNGHVAEIIAANYARLIVDEYQDCSIPQHAIVYYAAQSLDTVVLGDPMQSIFNWPGNPVADWTKEVCVRFPPAGQLNTPWRWKNAGKEELGKWLLDVRQRLETGQPIDLLTAPPEVKWVDLDGTEDYQRQLKAASTPAPDDGGNVLVIGNSKKPDSHRDFASRTPGAVTVENVDLRDVTEFAAGFDLDAGDALEKLVVFASLVMTNIGPIQFLKRIGSLQAGKARNPATEIETLALEFKERPTLDRAAAVLSGFSREAGTRVYRSEVLRVCLRALNQADENKADAFYDACVHFREQSRVLGRAMPSRAVGSTLLLKGLEADVAVILDAAHHDAKSLYVAMTRASRKLVICSTGSTIRGI